MSEKEDIESPISWPLSLDQCERIFAIHSAERAIVEAADLWRDTLPSDVRDVVDAWRKLKGKG